MLCESYGPCAMQSRRSWHFFSKLGQVLGLEAGSSPAGLVPWAKPPAFREILIARIRDLA